MPVFIKDAAHYLGLPLNYFYIINYIHFYDNLSNF